MVSATYYAAGVCSVNTAITIIDPFEPGPPLARFPPTLPSGKASGAIRSINEHAINVQVRHSCNATGVAFSSHLPTKYMTPGSMTSRPSPEFHIHNAVSQKGLARPKNALAPMLCR